MPSKAFFVCVVLSLAVFTAAAHQARMLDEVEPLELQNSTFTRQAYLDFTNDTKFANDYLNYSIFIYTQFYNITARYKKFSSGIFTFIIDANQTIENDFGINTQIDEDIQGSVQIINNEPTNLVLPDDLDVDKEAVKKLVLAYIKYVALRQINFKVALIEKYVDYDSLKILNPTYTYNKALIPDISIRFHDFNTSLNDTLGVSGTIVFQIDSYSKFLSFTPRYRGKSLIFYGVPVTITLNGVAASPTITVDEAAIKPFPLTDVKEIIRAYYLTVALPLIENLFY
jgi:hypothetical protein